MVANNDTQQRGSRHPGREGAAANRLLQQGVRAHACGNFSRITTKLQPAGRTEADGSGNGMRARFSGTNVPRRFCCHRARLEQRQS